MPSSGFDCAPKVALGGASKPQCTSQEALQHAKEDRYRRLLARELPKSAVRLQRAWRARQDRARAKEHLRAIWAQRYASIAALQDAYVPPEEMVMSVLPLLLALHLPPPGPLRTSLQQGASLDPLSPQDASCLRGGLYLVLRSLTAVPPSRCFLALGAVPHHQPALVSQLRRLATLCCAVIGQNHHDSDGLTESAAGRILALLTSFLSNSPGLEVVAAHFKVWLGGLPMVAHAARRLVCELEDEKAATESPANEQKLAILTAGAGNVVLAQVNLLSGGAIRCNGHTNGNHGTGGSAVALQNLVQLDLTAPGAVDCLSANGQALLQGAFCGVARCAEAASGKMDSVSSLYLLAALATLLVPVKSKSGHHPLPSAEAAAAFAPAAQALLDSAGNAAKFSFSADGFGTTTAALATAVQVISAREVADTLFTVLPHEQFAQMSVKLLLLTEANGTMSSCGVRLLSTLAFGMPRFLPALWHWLARVVRMPLEVPSEASRWEIPTLHQGINSVPALAVGPFALFCQVYVHYLSVADDFEFHEGKGPFTLSHQRAITATLTTLVFRTHIPIKKPAVKNGKSAAAVSPLQLAALGKTAPRLLRALYERDTRRRFCSPELWLEPYRRMSASQGAEATGASVLYALMRNRGDGEETSNSNSPSAAATSPTGGVGRTSPNKGNSPSSVAAGLAALLLQAPQCIPFEERVAVFRGLIEMDKHSRRYHLSPMEGGPQPLHVVIRRSHLLEDALDGLGPPGVSIRGPISATFINAQGIEENGIDMGGLTKELLEHVTHQVTRPDRALFSTTAHTAFLYPHPLAATTTDPDGSLLCLAGAVLGKALYEGILLQVPLAPFFVARLQGRLPTLDDLSFLDPEVHRNLTALKRYEGDAADLGLDFTVESDAFGALITEELLPGGSSIPVTSANKLQYVHLVADWHLRKRLDAGTTAFGRGLQRVLPPAWLRLFSPREVNQLLGGGEGGDIDVEDMKRYTQYNGYAPNSRTVTLFWKTVEKMSQEDRRALLRFATSCSRPPLGGFAHMRPQFTIQKVECGVAPWAMLGGKDAERLPSASTCANTLKLPNYQRAATVREKLGYAIKSGAGFELS